MQNIGRRNSPGFTLIEILIVLVVVGITAALISVNFARDSKADLNESAKRLSLILQAANNEAIVSGKSLAFIGNPSGYGFYHRDKERKWIEPLSDAPFASDQLPSSTSITDLKIDETRVPIATPLIFSSSGFNPPFNIVLASSDIRISVIGDTGGNIYVQDSVPQQNETIK